jgi:AraC-like DNA-binding protein
MDKQALNAYSYEKQEFDAPWHYHPEYELTYILSSRGVRYVGSSVENFEEHDLVLLGPNLPHCWKNTGNDNGMASAVVVHWSEDLLSEEWLGRVEFAGVRDLLANASKGLCFSPGENFQDRLLSLTTASPFEKFIGFMTVLDELSRADARLLCERSFHEQLNHDDHERINRIYQFVRKNYPIKITLSAVANEVHLTDESFSRLFSRLMGKPFFSFLNEYRINVASKLLIESDMDITEIALSSGFESLPFFYRQFRRYKGYSPGKYRSAYQKVSMP